MSDSGAFIRRNWPTIFIGLALATMLSISFVSTLRYSPAPGGNIAIDPTLLTNSLIEAQGTSSLSIDREIVGTGKGKPVGSGPLRLRIQPGQFLTFDGWATDDANRTAAGGLLIQVDDANRVAGIYGGARRDVAGDLNMPKAVYSGFHIVVPAALLPIGRHSLSFLVLTNDRHRFYWYPSRAIVDVTAKPVAGGAGSSSLSIDSITVGAGAPLVPSERATQLHVAAGQDLTFEGWATDNVRRAAAGGVSVQVDGSPPLPASYGAGRADVAADLHMPAAANSGFHVTVPAALLTMGQHRISFLVVTANGKSYYWYPNRVTVEVTQ